MGTLNPTPALSLDFKPIFIPKTIGQFLGEVSRIGSVSEKVLQVDDFVTRLETETRKIEAFKRELPLSMILVNDAIIALKEESMMLKNSSLAEPVLEEFIPLKNSCDEDAKFQITINKNDSSDKKNWLSSTQLWNTNENLNHKANSVEQIINKRSEVEDYGIKNPMRGNGLLTKTNRSNISLLLPHQQTSRKQRRSWSTELHGRFVNALQQLGGSQAATPKQIRELMQVDGLTNDEVKSHLQKYRLHTRKLPSLNTSSSNQYFEFSKCSNSQSGSPDGPLLNDRNRVDDEEDENSENYCCNGNL